MIHNATAPHTEPAVQSCPPELHTAPPFSSQATPYILSMMSAWY